MYIINQNEPDLNPILDRVWPSGSKFGSSWIGIGPQVKTIGSSWNVGSADRVGCFHLAAL